MVQINFAMKEVNCKVVYYGPGMSGKTTNLEIVHKKAPEQHRGELTSISTDGDRTLFFDFMPLDLGTIAGMRTKFQLYTVPGQVYYNSTRKLVLQGVDGVVFVADSDPAKIKENLESLANLEENLHEYGKDLRTLPHVFQWNKRDLPNPMTTAELNAQMNKYGAPNYEAVARTGEGVFPTLKALAASVLESLNRRDSSAPAPPSRMQAPAAPLPSHAAAPAAPAMAHASMGGGHAPMGGEARPGGFIAGASFPQTMGSAAPAAPHMAAPRSAPVSPPRSPVAAPRAAAPRAATPGARLAARPAGAAAPRPAAAGQPVRRAVRATPVPVPAAAAVAQDPVPAEPRSSRSVVIGVLLGALGALAVLGVVFLFLFR